jgi:hypothetical protein
MFRRPRRSIAAVRLDPLSAFFVIRSFSARSARSTERSTSMISEPGAWLQPRPRSTT